MPSDDRTRRTGDRPEGEADAPDVGATTDGRSAALASYRWTCPACGTARVGLTARHLAEACSINNLRAHIRALGDGAHGPADVLPAELASDLALSSYVEISTG